ncbi:tRNA epoxyqueuosine(34) reductase QueG [Eubacteriaceae bacterium ES2]|nr:tRNA epoxyqueuosine(34) reductase QueG [Eubacteriaceae bacterium ES2]
MVTEQIVKDCANLLGIDKIGFFTVEPLQECYEKLAERYQKGLVTGFETDVPEKRIDYHQYFADAKMGIAFGLNYYQGFKEPEDIKSRLKLSSIAWGQDYHKVLQEKGWALMKALNEKLSEAEQIQYKIFVDNSGLVDRGSAYRAGLGFFGKNNCLINEDLGSFFFIGQILLDQEIEYRVKEVKENSCGPCRICIDACPTGALGENFSYDPRKCLSYLTQKKEIDESEEQYFKDYLYGCDLCQRNCPFNQDLAKTKAAAFYTQDDNKYPSPEAILSMTNREFNERFKRTSAGWRGKKILLEMQNLL